MKVERYWARLIPEDAARRAQVVFAADHEAAMLERHVRIRALEAELAEWIRMRNEAMAVATSNRARIEGLEATLRRYQKVIIQEDDFAHDILWDEVDVLLNGPQNAAIEAASAAETADEPTGGPGQVEPSIKMTNEMREILGHGPLPDAPIGDDRWLCICGYTVRKRYTCLCGGREDNSEASRFKTKANET